MFIIYLFSSFFSQELLVTIPMISINMNFTICKLQAAFCILKVGDCEARNFRLSTNFDTIKKLYFHTM